MSASDAVSASVSFAIGALVVGFVAAETGLEPIQAGLVVAVAPILVEMVGDALS